MKNITPVQSTHRIDRFIIAIAIPFFLTLLFFISYFTAPITDESLPIAIALRFLQGQRPFVDDLSPYIGLGLLIAPIVKLSLLVHGGKNELILFLRHSYVLFSLFCGIYAFMATRKYLPTLIAFFIAISIATFHPFGINNFHYDTLGLTLWTIIIFQLYNFIFTTQNSSADYVIFSVLSLTLFFAYPTFLFFLPLLYCGCFFFLKEKKKFYLTHAITVVTTTLFMIWLIFSYFDIHLSDIKNAIHFNVQLSQFSAHGHSKIAKFIIIIQQLFTRYAPIVGLQSILIGAAFYFQKRRFLPKTLLSLALVTPLFFTHIARADFSNSFYYLNTIGLSSAIIYIFFLRQNHLAKRLFYSIWLTSFAAGLLTCMSSYNSELNFIIGFFPAVMTGFVFNYLTFQQLDKNDHLFPRLLIIFGLIVFSYSQLNYIYGNDERGINIYLGQKKYEQTGPFNGLYINPHWTNVLLSLQKEIPKIDTDENVFVYFGIFSCGYLLVDKLKIGDYLAYCPYEVDHFGKKIRTPNYTFDLSRTLDIPKEAILIYLSQSQYTKHATYPMYDIYYAEKRAF